MGLGGGEACKRKFVRKDAKKATAQLVRLGRRSRDTSLDI